jgi:hypothetical protein
MALILAGLIALGTLGWAALQVFAAGMSDVPGAKSGAGTTLAIGLPAAALVAASHWWPHVGW